MAKLFIISLILAVIQDVACDVCSYSLTSNNWDTAICTWGCCYTYIYPCCDEPFYSTAAFIVPIVLGSVFLFVCTVVVVIVIVVRRRRLQTTIQYAAPIGGHVVTTNAAGTYYPGAYNPQFPAQNMYMAQPNNGMAPMYTLQPPNGTAPMYAQPPNGAAPMYIAQPSNEGLPSYTSDSQNGAATTQTIPQSKQ